MTGLKAQLNRKLHECGRDPLSLFLLGCVIAAALITFMVLSFLLGYILWQGLPNIETGLFALQYNSENVSLFPALVDTVLMVIMALAIATPLGIFAAVYLVEYASRGNRLVSLVRVTADTLAGIPSIVYGLWGFYTLRPFMVDLQLSEQGFGIFTAAVVLAVMIIPYASSLSAEFISMVPKELKEGAYSLGGTRLDVIRRVIFPVAGSGIFASYILALGRALGETMAVTMLIGNTNILPTSFTSTGNTMASVIANQFGEADGLKLSSLIAIGLLLFLITAIINFIGKMIMKKLS